MTTPCRLCVPPVRHPGCLCDAKKAWDEQQRQKKRQAQKDAIYGHYKFQRVLDAKKQPPPVCKTGDGVGK